MKIAPITCCCYESRERIHYFDDSCAQNGFQAEVHGLGQPFPGFAESFVRYTLPHIEKLSEDHTHVLFIDGADSLVLSSLNEIVWKYERMGSPECLMSAEMDVPVGIRAPQFTQLNPWKFPNGGGYIAYIPLFLSVCKGLADKFSEFGNHQDWFRQAWPIASWTLDSECIIFQTMNGSSSVFPVAHRVLNTVTATWPSILHFAGGYSDPLVGRDERMRPWVEALK